MGSDADTGFILHGKHLMLLAWNLVVALIIILFANNTTVCTSTSIQLRGAGQQRPTWTSAENFNVHFLWEGLHCKLSETNWFCILQGIAVQLQWLFQVNVLAGAPEACLMTQIAYSESWGSYECWAGTLNCSKTHVQRFVQFCYLLL